MITLRILMLLAAVAVCYVLFLHVGTTPSAARSSGADLPATASAADRDQYKQALDKAHAVARQMQAQRAEADAQ